MDRNAFENHVVCMTRPGILGHTLEQSGIRVSSLNMKKGMPDLRAVLRLRFMASLIKPDIIQCWMYHANLLGLTLLNPKRTLWNIRCSDMDLSVYGPIYRFTVKAGATFSQTPSVVIANSYAGRDVHEELGYRPKRWAIITNGFNTYTFKPNTDARVKIRTELKIPQEAFVIGLVCRCDPMKDHATFFKAAEAFLQSCPGGHFILAGRGVSWAYPSLENYLPYSLDKTSFHLLGERSDTDKIFTSLDIATSSSAWGEGLPNAIGEAMSTGIPCVVTDVGDSAVLVGDAGIVVPKKNPQALCAAWQHLLNAGSDYRKNLGISARQRIIDHYSLTSMVQAYEELYKNIITIQN